MAGGEQLLGRGPPALLLVRHHGEQSAADGEAVDEYRVGLVQRVGTTISRWYQLE